MQEAEEERERDPPSLSPLCRHQRGPARRTLWPGCREAKAGTPTPATVEWCRNPTRSARKIPPQTMGLHPSLPMPLANHFGHRRGGGGVLSSSLGGPFPLPPPHRHHSNCSSTPHGFHVREFDSRHTTPTASPAEGCEWKRYTIPLLHSTAAGQEGRWSPPTQTTISSPSPLFWFSEVASLQKKSGWKKKKTRSSPWAAPSPPQRNTKIELLSDWCPVPHGFHVDP